MTNAEALQSITELNFVIKDSALQKALTDQGLTSDGIYSLENKKAVDLAWCALIWTKCSSAKSVQEGQVTITEKDASDLLSLRDDILESCDLPSSRLRPRINRADAW